MSKLYISIVKGGENTKSKWLVIISIFLILLCLNAVSASEDACKLQSSSDDALTVENQDMLSDSEVGNFTELANYLSGKSEVTLNKSYIFSDGDSIIALSDSIIINGDGHYIDGDGQSGIFSINSPSGSHIVLNNIAFINSNSTRGGAIDQGTTTGDISIIGCTFSHNTVSGSGGAVYLKTTGKVVIKNNMFFYNKANACGGLYTTSNNVEFYNNTFIANTAVQNAGALQVGANVLVNNSTFISNVANQGGAIYVNANLIKIYDCTFESNNAASNGGAICAGSNAKNLNVTKCDFTHNHGKYGGAVHVNANNPRFYDCTFELNNASAHGGAVYADSNSKNLNITKCNFTENSALTVTFPSSSDLFTNVGGGAVLSAGANTLISQSTFTKNNASGSNGGAVLLTADKGRVENSSFIDNFARRGAGLSVFNNNGVVNNCNFTNNSVKFINQKYGPEGAGIYINGAKGTISNCKFENNTVIYDTASTDHLGGGIYIGGDNNIVRDCKFIANNATYGAGVYSSNDAHNTQIINSTFEKNIALYSGASGAGIVSVGPNPKIISCNFTKNYSDHVGGGIYIDLSNTVTKNAGYITDCRFINNSAKNAGGAIHLRDRNEMNFMTHISNVTFENNTATTGGALSVNGPVNVTNSKFTGNNATKGSAIRVAADKSTTNLYLENVTFKNNRADSASLSIDVNPKESYYPSEVTVNITLKGYDNIANAIWNEKDNTHVYTSNITYDVYRNGVLETVSTPLGYQQTTGPLAKALLSASSRGTSMLPYQQTVNGASNSDDASLVWQDDREDAQILNVKITNTDKNLVVLDETGYITDVYGNVTEIMKRLKPGHYTVYAKHPGDVYYTEIENTNDFTILYDFNVSKDTDDVLVGVNQTVTYNITLNNTGELVISNIKVNDTIPEGFILLKYTTTWIGVTQDEINQNPTVYGNWKYDGEVFTIDNTVVNSDNVNANSALPEKTSIVLTLTFKATEIGTFNNTVNITSDELTAKNATSQNTTVVPIILNVNKTANVTVVGNNSLVNFTIKVNSTSLVNATDVTVVDCLPAGLDFVDAGFVPVNGIEISWDEVSDSVQWNISRLDNKTVVELWITARVNTTEMGNLTNNVSVTSKENKTPVTNKTNVTVVPVKLNINKTANVTVVGNNSLVNFTIKVKSTSLVNATNVTVVDSLPDGLDFVDAGFTPVDGIEINWDEVSGGVQWNISRLDNKTVVELWVTVRVNTTKMGNLTNSVNVTSKENKTPVTNKTNVTVAAIKLNVNKTANVTVVGNNSLVNFTIKVNSTSLVNATNVTVVDSLPDGLDFVDAGFVPVNGIEISWDEVSGGVQWNI
ncbi:MAG: right-handed parallel beta-helix repeat-containing protein, partial [Methanobrevibacter sp.]|nr:right-handed parallel beta-helix repeat-containing protein [Methanobrevibacter sp.]